MILDLEGNRLTPGQAARQLVYHFGGQLDGMQDGFEWDHVVDREHLTDADIVLIRQLCVKHLHRVWKFLRLND